MDAQVLSIPPAKPPRVATATDDGERQDALSRIASIIRAAPSNLRNIIASKTKE